MHFAASLLAMQVVVEKIRRRMVQELLQLVREEDFNLLLK